MKKLLVVSMLVIFLVSGCGKTDSVEEKNITYEQYKEIFDANNYIIIDVRANVEYNANHVVDAINIPYDEIDESIDLDKEKTIFVYCQSGRRSGIAKDTLENLGYEVIDLGAFADITLEKVS